MTSSKAAVNLIINNLQDCCEACKVGLIVGASLSRCSLEPFGFGQPWDESYFSCCYELKADDAFVLTEEDESKEISILMWIESLIIKICMERFTICVEKISL